MRANIRTSLTQSFSTAFPASHRYPAFPTVTHDLGRAHLPDCAAHSPPGSPARRTQTGPAREQRSVTWYDLACRFTDMKWPRLAAKSRMSIADALATIPPALVTTTRGTPDPQTP